MLDKAIRQAEVQHAVPPAPAPPGTRPQRCRRRPAPTFSSTVTSRSWLVGQLQHQSAVQRLDEAHVGHGSIECLGGLQAGLSMLPKARKATRRPRGEAPPGRAGSACMLRLDRARPARPRADSAPRPAGRAGMPCTASAGTRSRRWASSPPGWGCSADRTDRRRRDGSARPHRPGRRGRWRTPPADSGSPHRGSAGRSRAAERSSKWPPPASAPRRRGRRQRSRRAARRCRRRSSAPGTPGRSAPARSPRAWPG